MEFCVSLQSPYLVWQFSTWRDLCSSLSPSARRTRVIPRWRGSPPPAAALLRTFLHFCKPPHPREVARCRRTLRSPPRRAEAPSAHRGHLYTRCTRSLWRSSGSSSARVWTLCLRQLKSPQKTGCRNSPSTSSKIPSQKVDLYPSETFFLFPRNMSAPLTVLSHQVRNQAIPVCCEVTPRCVRYSHLNIPAV